MSTILEVQRHEPAWTERTSLFGIPLDNVTIQEAVEAIFHCLESDHPHHVCFVNAHCVNTSFRIPAYLRVLHQASLAFADGMGLKLAGLALGTPIRDNVNGTDLFPRLCAALEGTGRKLFLCGARPGIADRTREWIGRHYPNVVVSGCHHGYFSRDEEPVVVQKIAESRSDILLAAFGVPRQELWIARHLPALGVKAAIGVGGLFDFYSGRIPRAPLWVRKMGMEWFYRLCQEPRRLWKRYLLGNPQFLAHVARARLRPATGRIAPAGQRSP
jgi:N-acetylglucosaminyldiphosphoundecaprenol N-acetyl-beta-D-mannosaminyltransferase